MYHPPSLDSASQVVQNVLPRLKNVPANIEHRIQSPGQEDPLKEQMATHCSNLASEIPWTEKTGGLQSMRVTKELDMAKQLYNNKNAHRI